MKALEVQDRLRLLANTRERFVCISFRELRELVKRCPVVPEYFQRYAVSDYDDNALVTVHAKDFRKVARACGFR